MNSECVKKIVRQSLLMLTILGLSGSCAWTQVLLKRNVILMGSRFDITIVEKDTVLAQQRINQVIAEVTRIENLISEWKPETQISQVNQNAGIKPVKVDREVFELTRRGIEFSKLSGGAFDTSIAALDRLWKFDGSMTEMPPEDAIKNSIRHVGYQHILLDSLHSTIYLPIQGMKIGFGSIGKGYAADKGRELMQSLGVPGGIVNASGDLSTWGTQPSQKAWLIGINNPFESGKIVRTFKLGLGAAATSGSYEKYAEINNIRYSHIINPKTGYPATGLVSATIIGPSAEFANGLSTSVMVLGEKEGIQFLKQFPLYRYVLITDQGKIIKSK